MRAASVARGDVPACRPGVVAAQSRNIWQLGYDPTMWDQQADPKAQATAPRMPVSLSEAMNAPARPMKISRTRATIRRWWNWNA